jgi:DNA-binding response OmpR family regulator
VPGATQRDGERRRVHKLLLIDDEACILAAMAEYFAGLGYDVDCAADDGAARSLVERHRYHIVITDLRLSRSDRFEGFEILACLRRRAPQADCIVLTAHGCAESEARALQQGASAFLQKPQPLSEVAAVVAKLTARRADSACLGESRAFTSAG